MTCQLKLVSVIAKAGGASTGVEQTWRRSLQQGEQQRLLQGHGERAGAEGRLRDAAPQEAWRQTARRGRLGAGLLDRLPDAALDLQVKAD